MTTTAPTDHYANFGNAEFSHAVSGPLTRIRRPRSDRASGLSFRFRWLTPPQGCLTSASDREEPNRLQSDEPIRKGGA